ncbi:MAG: alternate-type signal peptide domain-containing protein [Bifidobacteriaceae bacterium]|jgi:alternate signal-mediated exported protein|nr:alternate-type signal peptide domain-containing protein [Bifidobacteriaceae bacterium]
MTINPQTEGQRRSRRFKGLVAGAAGVALLLGGSTFALWQHSVSLPEEYVNHGELKVAVGAPVAYDLNVAGNETTNSGESNVARIDDLRAFRAVPGSTVEIDTSVVVTAVGDNMKYNVFVEFDDGIDDEDWDITVTTSGIPVNVAPGRTQIATNQVAGKTIPLEIVATFKDSTGETDRQSTGGSLDALDMSAYTFTVEQVAISG